MKTINVKKTYLEIKAKGDAQLYSATVGNIQITKGTHIYLKDDITDDNTVIITQGASNITWKGLDAVDLGITQDTTQGGGGGTTDYTALTNKPSINGNTLIGNTTIDKTSIGLDSVDNTSDIDKPISTLVQEALSKKQDAPIKTIDVGITLNGSITEKQFEAREKLIAGLKDVKIGESFYIVGGEKRALCLLMYRYQKTVTDADGEDVLLDCANIVGLHSDGGLVYGDGFNLFYYPNLYENYPSINGEKLYNGDNSLSGVGNATLQGGQITSSTFDSCLQGSLKGKFFMNGDMFIQGGILYLSGYIPSSNSVSNTGNNIILSIPSGMPLIDNANRKWKVAQFENSSALVGNIKLYTSCMFYSASDGYIPVVATTEIVAESGEVNISVKYTSNLTGQTNGLNVYCPIPVKLVE